MQLVCRTCGAEVSHTCSPSSSSTLNPAVKPCPLKGAIWVYVTDPDGSGILGVEVKVAGATKTTDKLGFVGFNGLDAGPATVELTGLTGEAAKDYELPKVKTFEASVANNQVSMVELQLTTWIEICVVDSKGKPLHGVTVTLKLADDSTVTKTIDEDVFRLPNIVGGDCSISFAALCDAEWSVK